MPKVDEALHFDDYRDQTAVKHDLLEAYLNPYFHILKDDHPHLLYIDGFAGEGVYNSNGKLHFGSPLRAMKLVADTPNLTDKVDFCFIEKRDEAFPVLKNAVESFHREHPTVRKPKLYHASFEQGLQQFLDARGNRLPPTFLFVDPCGVAGTSFQAIKQVVSFRSCEAFILYNIAGVRRIIGQGKVGPALLGLMGSEERARQMISLGGERALLDCYLDTLRKDLGLTFLIPFRIEFSDKRQTSHYLIHATKNKRGFAIMKDIMWMRGRSPEGDGCFEFTQASHTGVKYMSLFEEVPDDKQAILKALATGPKVVSYFTEDWVVRPDDVGCRSSYRTALLELEQDRKIEVIKDGLPVPASARPRPKGKVTIAEHYDVRLCA
ncbi:MAG TPA: three-Cys-motif partner protein TcmP [Tepidisphaeraceae bacterium]|jgi:three-Cys-motif partner protein